MAEQFAALGVDRLIVALFAPEMEALAGVLDRTAAALAPVCEGAV
jgi:hypothetical protein